MAVSYGRFAETNQDYFRAAGLGDVSALRTELASGRVSVNEQDQDGDTALYYASCHHRVDAVRFLLRQGADPELHGSNPAPLCVAAALGDEEVVDLLIGSGADIDCCPEKGTPLNHAIKQSQFFMALHLLHEGADPNLPSLAILQTPLMGAAFRGDAQLVRELIEYGANATRRDREGDSALTYLALGKSLNKSIAVALLEAGAPIDDLYSNGCVFTRYDLASGQINSYLRETVTTSVLYDDEVALTQMNPNSPNYSRLCY